MQQWEYLHIQPFMNLPAESRYQYLINGSLVEYESHLHIWDFLSEYGEEGWELISVDWETHSLVFKRLVI